MEKEMSKEEMQNFLVKEAQRGSTELEAYKSLMEILGIEFPVDQNSSQCEKKNGICLDMVFMAELAWAIQKRYKEIYDKDQTNFGVIEDILVDGKNYYMRYNHDMGTHYIFEIYDGDNIVVRGDFPAVPTEKKYRWLRFFNQNGDMIFRHTL